MSGRKSGKILKSVKSEKDFDPIPENMKTEDQPLKSHRVAKSLVNPNSDRIMSEFQSPRDDPDVDEGSRPEFIDNNLLNSR